jgi:hypothetical protein
VLGLLSSPEEEATRVARMLMAQSMQQQQMQARRSRAEAAQPAALAAPPLAAPRRLLTPRTAHAPLPAAQRRLLGRRSGGPPKFEELLGLSCPAPPATRSFRFSGAQLSGCGSAAMLAALQLRPPPPGTTADALFAPLPNGGMVSVPRAGGGGGLIEYRTAGGGGRPAAGSAPDQGLNVLRACVCCRVSKTACSDSRPCERCNRLGLICVNEQEEPTRKRACVGCHTGKVACEFIGDSETCSPPAPELLLSILEHPSPRV